MNIKTHYLIAAAIVPIFLTSCGDALETPELETYPIRGRVIVDGVPGAQIRVICNSPDQKEDSAISGLTDAEGNFSIGTQTKDDGAPVGTYKLTFEWKKRSMMTGRIAGADKLKGVYSDPETSKIEVTVKPGDPIDLGEIKLSVANEPDPEKSKPSLLIDSEFGE